MNHETDEEFSRGLNGYSGLWLFCNFGH